MAELWRRFLLAQFSFGFHLDILHFYAVQAYERINYVRRSTCWIFWRYRSLHVGARRRNWRRFVLRFVVRRFIFLDCICFANKNNLTCKPRFCDYIIFYSTSFTFNISKLEKFDNETFKFSDCRVRNGFRKIQLFFFYRIYQIRITTRRMSKEVACSRKRSCPIETRHRENHGTDFKSCQFPFDISLLSWLKIFVQI